MPTPNVLMMVGNNISHDTRVLKSALALADGGASVTLLGLASSGHHEESRLGPVRILRVPVAWRLRDAHRIRRAKVIKSRLVPEPVTKRTRSTWALRASLLAAEAQDLGGRANQTRATLGKVERRLLEGSDRVRTGLSTREVRWRRELLDWWDAQTVGTSWRRDVPELYDYELAFRPVIDELDWEVLHAHDVHHMGTAAQTVARRRAEGRPARWVYDAHEFVAGLSEYPGRSRRKIAGYLDAEREYVRSADAVITVSPPLAEELQRRYQLPERPTVVMNTPPRTTSAPEGFLGIREVCGLAPDVPLIVYSGGITAARGIQTAVEALPQLPGVHLAIVCVPHTGVGPAKQLAAQADDLGVGQRLHLVDPVAPDTVSAFLSSADVGIVPMLHFGSHEVAMGNKLFEYLFAGLPVLVSDVKAQADFVGRHGVGAVFVAGDASSFATSLRTMLDTLPQLRHHIAETAELEPYRWEHQARSLRDLYRTLLGPDALGEPAQASLLGDLTEVAELRDDRPSVLGIGPANMAGQASAWADAVQKYLPGVRTHVVVVDRNLPILFPGDQTVPSHVYSRDAEWSQKFQATAQQEWTHALLESGRPLFGFRNGRDFEGDARVLRAVGIRVGLVLHGSEIRDPRRHAMLTPWSPFTDPEDELTARLQAQRDVLWGKVDAFLSEGQGPVFVSTPDLLGDVPGAIWLPVVVDPEAWVGGMQPLDRDVPVVVHAPSRASLKGSAAADEVLQSLADRGLVDYRRAQDVKPADMQLLIRDADIVLDQFALGSYGALACQAMAAGRVVVGHVLEDVRRIASGAAGMPLPLVEADPSTLGGVIEGLLADREAARTAAVAGQGFVARLHDGRNAADLLTQHLGLRGD